MTGSSYAGRHSNISCVLFDISTKKTKPMVTYLSALNFSNQPLKRGSKFTLLKMKFFQLVEKCKNPVKQTHLWFQCENPIRCIQKIDNVQELSV